MFTTESISKSPIRLPAIDNYLLAGLIAGIIIIAELFYIGISVNQRFESTSLALNVLLPSKNIDK